jgi:lipopolysaccharide transport system ATP-binding protein
MQLRLAFSVAAFLEPEILVIDEVLAVGDVEFQKKCLRKMEDVSKSGRTILFVSHNMAAVDSLCGKAILLNGGSIAFSGTTQQAINEYQNVLETSAGKHIGTIVPEKNGVVKKIEMFCDGSLSPTAYMGCKFEIKVHFNSEEALESPVLGLIFKDAQNTPLIGVNNRHYNGLVVGEPLKSGSISMLIPALPFFEGNYFIDLHFGNLYRDIEVHRECLQLIVDPLKFSEAGELPDKQLNKFFIKDMVWSTK